MNVEVDFREAQPGLSGRLQGVDGIIRGLGGKTPMGIEMHPREIRLSGPDVFRQGQSPGKGRLTPGIASSEPLRPGIPSPTSRASLHHPPDVIPFDVDGRLVATKIRIRGSTGVSGEQPPEILPAHQGGG
ncbi:MAG: hypothetical protein GY859_09455 [Desulfobacterales bacterium]|nr:hypothetical protein [Desulfobacterales bacterium]